MEVTEAKPEHREKLAEYLAEYWKGRGMDFSAEWATDYLKNGMSSEMSEKRFVVFGDERVSGTVALLMYAEHAAEIRDEVWDDDSTGDELLDKLIEFAKNKGIRKVFSLALDVKINFYKRHKFRQEGMLKDHFTPGENVTVMSRFI